jgi:hypothetical protein
MCRSDQGATILERRRPILTSLWSLNKKIELHAAACYQWQSILFYFNVFIWFSIIHHYLCQFQI